MTFKTEPEETVRRLEERIRVLEEKVSRLEKKEGTASRPVASTAERLRTDGHVDLVTLVTAALAEYGSLDSESISLKIEAWGHKDVTKSDVNKILYANKSLFKKIGKDGAKPVWTLV